MEIKFKSLVKGPYVDEDEEEEIDLEAYEEFLQRMEALHLDENGDEDEEVEETNKKPSNGPDYEVIDAKTVRIDYKPLENVIGHNEQKEELLNVLKWFNNAEYLKSRGVTFPKGVLLFGSPGNGKSFLIKELIKGIDSKVYIFKGGSSSIAESINNLFKIARENKKAVIVIDELDLLINRDRRVIRALQENLDGVESDDNILVLTATNNYNEIPNALTRNGRLEKVLKIPYLDEKESVELLKRHFKEFNIELPEDFDDEEVGLQLCGIPCSGIKAVVNDLVLRNGFKNLTTSMLDNSINNISNKVKDKTREGNIQVAIHEAGHAVVAHHFSKYFKVNKLNISGYGGYCSSKEIEEGYWDYEKALAHIKIAMAGNIAERLICKDCSLGSESDLQEARMYAYNLINISGYSSCWETLPVVKPTARTETEVKRRKNERKIEKLLKKCEKETYKIVRNNLNKINYLAKALFEKKKLKSSEILAIIG